MACPQPANLQSCKPKCRCVGSGCPNAYLCDDPCGNGDPLTFDPTSCSCPENSFSKPALFINAYELNCTDRTDWNGWWRYAVANEVQKTRPVSVVLAPYNIDPCNGALETVGNLAVIATWADGSSQTFFGGVDFTANHNIQKVLSAWDWGDSKGDQFYPLSIIRTPN